jgi:hypothetical protein
VPAVDQGAKRRLYVLPAALVLEGPPHRLRDERTPLTPADSPVELGYEVVALALMLPCVSSWSSSGRASERAAGRWPSGPRC